MISGFADYVLQQAGSYRYSDPDGCRREHHPATILPAELDKLRGMMLDLINEPEHFRRGLASLSASPATSWTLRRRSRRIRRTRFTMHFNKATS
jgi:ribosomal protein L16 Arg81 hydroxylase